MIFTRIRIDGLYGFKNTELDLTYPKKNTDTPLEYEYLKERPNFRFKRLCIIAGANASGKTSFGKVLCEMLNIIQKGLPYIQSESGMSKFATSDSVVEVEFVFQDNIFRTLRIELRDNLYWFNYADVNITKSDSVETCRKKILDILTAGEAGSNGNIITNINDKSDYITKWESLYDHLSPHTHVWAFSFSDSFDNSDNKLIASSDNQSYKDVLLKILQTFDPSIDRVSASVDDESGRITEYTIHFKHGKFCRMDVDGKVDKEYQSLLSMGTYQGISIAGFIHFILSQLGFDKDASGTFFLDEKMAYSHTEIERVIVNLIAQTINEHSQFFYTTHNYDILKMRYPHHSFVFLTKKNEEPRFIWATEACDKNDRNILSYVEANFFSTIPDTSLLDEILWRE